MTAENFKSLTDVYQIYYIKNSNLILENNKIVQEEAEAILKVLGIFIENKTINYKSIKVPLKPQKEIKEPFKSILSNLSAFDIECIEKILNKPEYESFSSKMSPLFDSIGWILENRTGKYKIHLIGSPLYKVWKEVWEDDEYEPWYIDVQPEDIDWRAKDNWVDNLNLLKIKKPLWKNFLNKKV